MDCTAISADELDVLTRINADKNLISAIMRGDYTYAGMTRAQMIELQSISDKIRSLKNS